MKEKVVKMKQREESAQRQRVDKKNDEVMECLRVVMCETYALFTQTQGAHWNYTGPDFAGTHVLLEQQYTDLYMAVDEIAERIRALDGNPPANLFELMEGVSDKYIRTYRDSMQTRRSGESYIHELIYNHEHIARSLEDAIEICDDADDDASEDIMIRRKQFHDKTLWMLRSMVRESGGSVKERRNSSKSTRA